MQKSKTDLDLEILDETMEKREEIEFANDVAATKDLSESQAQVKDLKKDFEECMQDRLGSYAKKHKAYSYIELNSNQ